MTEVGTRRGPLDDCFFCPDGGYRVAIRKVYYVICWFSVFVLHLTIKVVAKI